MGGMRFAKRVKDNRLPAVTVDVFDLGERSLDVCFCSMGHSF